MQTQAWHVTAPRLNSLQLQTLEHVRQTRREKRYMIQCAAALQLMRITIAQVASQASAVIGINPNNVNCCIGIVSQWPLIKPVPWKWKVRPWTLM